MGQLESIRDGGSEQGNTGPDEWNDCARSADARGDWSVERKCAKRGRSRGAEADERGEAAGAARGNQVGKQEWADASAQRGRRFRKSGVAGGVETREAAYGAILCSVFSGPAGIEGCGPGCDRTGPQEISRRVDRRRRREDDDGRGGGVAYRGISGTVHGRSVNEGQAVLGDRQVRRRGGGDRQARFADFYARHWRPG